MVDRANVVRLEPDVKRHVRARLARLPAQVRAFHETGEKALAGLLLRYFDASDDALFDLADKAPTNAEQNAYFDAMRELRVQRKDIERAIFDSVDELFARLVGSDERDQAGSRDEVSAEQLASADQHELGQMVALEATINRVSARQSMQVEPLLRGLGAMTGKEITAEQYPFGVHNLCHAAMDEFKALTVDIKAKLMLFQLFEGLVINELSGLNQELVQCLRAEGVDSAPDASEPEEVAGSSAALRLDPGRRELLSLLSFVQKLPLNASGPNGLDVERVLATVQHRRGVQLHLSRVEQETISLVQMLFRFILQGQEIAEPMQEQLCRLQVPVLKVALLDSDFLANKKHPVRRLLNEMATVAAEWQAGSDRAEAVFQLMRASVERVLARFDANTAVFSDVLANFTSVIEKEKHNALVQEKRTVDAEDGKARAAQARQHVAAEIGAKTQGKTLPQVVSALINGPWSNVLFVTSLKYGFASPQWRTQLKVLADLVWSVQPTLSADERKQLAQLAPELMARLRSGLDSVSYNPFEVEELFLELDQLHWSLIRGEVSAVSKDAHQVRSAGALKADDRRDAADDGAVAVAVAEGASGDTEESDQLPADDPHLIAVSAFTHGAWFDLTCATGQTWRCRLAAYIKPTDKYIFVDRNGVKVAEQSRNELALSLKHGRLSPLDNNMLFDKALESVVSSLRKNHVATPWDKKPDS